MTRLEVTEQKHIVAFNFPFWGHTKPLCALLSKVVRVQEIYATLFAAADLHSKVVKEVERQFNLPEEQLLRNRIRIVSLPGVKVPFEYDELQSSFVLQYEKLYKEQPITVTSDSEEMYDRITPPQLVILDHFCYNALKGVRGISGSTIPVYAWQSCAVSALLYLFGPEELGGHGDLAAKIAAIDAEDIETREMEICKIHCKDSGQLIKVPGIPPMYDYENRPQLLSAPVSEAYVVLFQQYVHRFFNECDGFIHQSNVLFEGGAIGRWQEWVGSRLSVAIGPISPPPSLEELEKEIGTDPISMDVELFLNKAHDKYGPYSVVYVSFGTVWWSSEPEKIWAVVDTLIEKGVPFLLSHASPAAVIPEAVTERISSSGLGFISLWLPQQMILRHKACGWFLSHCGHNSVTESLSAGVPMICWPFDADQPMNAANVCGTHNAGYELFEVRNGNGLRPVHRLGDKRPEGTVDAVRREFSEIIDKSREKVD